MLIDGRYRYLRPLGQGFSGDVCLVEDEKTKSELALKFLKVEDKQISPEQLLERFKQEFSILQKLHHPHIARIADFGFDENLKRHYFTEEFIEGSSIFEATANRSVSEVEELIVQTLRALEFLHARHIFHFDLKPANLLVEAKTQRVKIIDFGLANIPGQIFAGTPTYMAPEICLREPRDGRADLYALGVIWYQALSRVNPFSAGNSKETIERQIHLEVAPICRVRPDLPAYMDTILSRLLAKNPAQRYSRPALIIRDLNFLGQRNYPIETGETSVGYLPEEGELVGREEEWKLIQNLVQSLSSCALSPSENKSSLAKKNSSPPVLLIAGGSGLGKTRLCQEIRYLGQLSGASLLIRDFHRAMSAQELNATRAEMLEPPDKTQAVVIACHPQDAKSLEEWLEPERFQKILLSPFTQAQIGQYLSRVTGANDVPASLCEEIASRTEGNPRHLRELLATCFANHLFFDASGRWGGEAFEDLRVEIEKLPLPTTLTEWFASRLRKLPPEVGKLLRLLALVEHPIPQSTFEHFAGSSSDSVSLLSFEGWIEWENQTIALHNPSLKEWLLLQMGQEERKAWHDVIADHPERFPQEDGDYHRVLGSKTAEILPAFERRYEKLSREGKWQEILEEWKWIWPSAPLGEKKIQLGIRGISIFMEMKRNEEVEALIQSLQELIAKLPLEERPLFQTTLEEEEIEWFLKVERYKEAQVKIEEILKRDALHPAASQNPISLLAHSQSLIRQVHLRNYLGRIALELGNLDLAESILAETWQKTKTLDLEGRRRTFNNDLGLVHLSKGNFKAAASQFQEELPFIEEFNEDYLKARCHYNLGDAYLRLGEKKKAEEHLRMSYEIAQPMGQPDLLLRILNAMGNLYNQLEWGEDATRCYERAMHLAERMGDRSSTAAIATNLGILLHALARNADALSYLTHARHLLRSRERTKAEESCLARCLLEIGLIQIDEKDPAAQLTLAEAEKIADTHLQPYIEEAKQGLSFKPRERNETPASIEESISRFEAKTQIRELSPQESFGLPLGWKNFLKIHRQLARSASPFKLLHEILEMTVETAKAEGGMILKAQGESFQVIEKFKLDLLQEIPKEISYLARKVMASDEPLLLDEESQLEEEQQSMRTLSLKSAVLIPIVSQGKKLGVIYLPNGIKAETFDAIEFPLLQGFSDEVGILFSLLENPET